MRDNDTRDNIVTVSTTFAREIAGGSASRTLHTAASSTPSLIQTTVVETGSTQALAQQRLIQRCTKVVLNHMKQLLFWPNDWKKEKYPDLLN